MFNGVRALAAVVGLSESLFAEGSGQISGIIHDQSGAVVPGAKITVAKAGTNVARTTVSGTDGSYRFPDLRPTGYTLSAEAAGLQVYRETGIQLLANQSLTIDMTMNVGAATLDATSNNDIDYNLNQEFRFPDALQEFSGQTSNFRAQYSAGLFRCDGQHSI